MGRHLSPGLAFLVDAYRIPTRQALQISQSRASSSLSCRAHNKTPWKHLAFLSPCASTPASRWFSSSSAQMDRKKGKPKTDKRITLIRFFLQHPKTPRPLRFSRNRYLRHWTIHRAWQLYQAKQRAARELQLEKQYRSMHSACEELRTGVGDGGKLFRLAMIKTGVFTRGPPIEYGRLQTDSPSREGWNYEWKRPTK